MFLDIRNICEYSIRTRSRLGLFSELLDNNNIVTKVEADRVYRNVFIISDLFKSVKYKEFKKNLSEYLAIFEMQSRFGEFKNL